MSEQHQARLRHPDDERHPDDDKWVRERFGVLTNRLIDSLDLYRSNCEGKKGCQQLQKQIEKLKAELVKNAESPPGKKKTV